MRWTRIALTWLLLASLLGHAVAQDVPRTASQHRAELTRVAHAVWGLDAPVAMFAAQIHQESGWRADAVSHVGARGMAQFMPATARWWCELQGVAAQDCIPTNPTWAMRAMVGYDLWLYERVRGASEFDRSWAALRAYNGGLGHWQNEASLVRPSLERQAVDSACGQARRHVSHCAENLGYPRRILLTLQLRYAGWGRGVTQ